MGGVGPFPLLPFPPLLPLPHPAIIKPSIKNRMITLLFFFI
jgi:hypothetical protein